MAATLGPGATRRLLKRLRDTMAAGGSAQQRLDKIVRIIAGELIAEVCSVYVTRAGQVLELFATEGLKPEAVHKTMTCDYHMIEQNGRVKQERKRGQQKDHGA